MTAATFVKFTLRLEFQFGSATVQIKCERCVHWFVLLAQFLCMNSDGEFVCEDVLALNVNDQMTFRCAVSSRCTGGYKL